MSTTVPLIVRLLASSVSVAGRAGKIVRDVMSKGELGIIEKVSIKKLLVFPRNFLASYFELRNLMTAWFV